MKNMTSDDLDKQIHKAAMKYSGGESLGAYLDFVAGARFGISLGKELGFARAVEMLKKLTCKCSHGERCKNCNADLHADWLEAQGKADKRPILGN